jgi:hypothetical protein
LLKQLPEAERRATGARARMRVLQHHTAAHRAAELERYVHEARERDSIARFKAAPAGSVTVPDTEASPGSGSLL